MGSTGVNTLALSHVRMHTCTYRHTRACAREHVVAEALGSGVVSVLQIVSRPTEIIYQIWNSPDIPAMFWSSSLEFLS